MTVKPLITQVLQPICMSKQYDFHKQDIIYKYLFINLLVVELVTDMAKVFILRHKAPCIVMGQSIPEGSCLRYDIDVVLMNL